MTIMAAVLVSTRGSAERATSHGCFLFSKSRVSTLASCQSLLGWITSDSSTCAYMTALIFVCVRSRFSAVGILDTLRDILIAPIGGSSGVTFHEAQIALTRQWVGEVPFRPKCPS